MNRGLLLRYLRYLLLKDSAVRAGETGAVFVGGPVLGGLDVHSDSVLLAHLLVSVLRVGDELLASRVHHRIEIFQRNLAQEIRDIVVHFHRLEYAVAAHEFQAHRLEDRAATRAICGLRLHFTFLAQAQRLDEAGLELKPRGSGLHQGPGLNGAGFRLGQLALDGNQIPLIGQLDFDGDFTHLERVRHSSRRRKRSMKARIHPTASDKVRAETL